MEKPEKGKIKVVAYWEHGNPKVEIVADKKMIDIFMLMAIDESFSKFCCDSLDLCLDEIEIDEKEE